jgi:hypothetical protein
MGWTRKSSKALVNREMAKRISKVTNLDFWGGFTISVYSGLGYWFSGQWPVASSQ